MTLAAQDGNGHSVQSTSVSRLRAIDNDAAPMKVLVTLQRQLPGRTHARAIVDSTLARRSLSVLEFDRGEFDCVRRWPCRIHTRHWHGGSVRGGPCMTAK
jgi:hypothetical protein